MIGTKPFNIDFHVHTPNSNDYQEKDNSAADILIAAKKKNLSAIVITDHNTIAGVAEYLELAKVHDIVVFPGFEISTPKGHFIAVFDPESSIEDIDDSLTTCGIDKSKRGDEKAISSDIDTVFEAITSRHGLVIAAHIDGPKGMFEASKVGEDNIRIYKNKNLSAIELINESERDKYILGQISGFNRRMPCIQGSDAHTIAEIGKRFSVVRMQHVNIRGLIQAFYEPKLRIFIPSEFSEVTFPYIKSIEVNQGFLSGQEFQFNPGLNCLIGGPGSGKSTILEFIRFCLNQVSTEEKFLVDNNGKLEDLAKINARITIKVIQKSGEEIHISRIFNKETNPITITNESEETIFEGINIDKFFPILAYSQGEALSISQNSSAQLGLIDKHINIHGFQDEIEGFQFELEKQVEGLSRLFGIIQNRDKYTSELATIDAQLNIKKLELETLTAVQKSPVVLSHHKWVSERDYLESVVNGFDALKDSVTKQFDSIDIRPTSFELSEEETPNKDIIKSVKEEINRISQQLDINKSNIIVAITSIEQIVNSMANNWKTRYETHAIEYQEKQTEIGESRIQILISDIEELNHRISKVKAELHKISLAEKTFNEVKDKRKKIIENIDDRKARILALRENKARDLQKNTKGSISVRIIPNGNVDHYKTVITGIMKGSHASEAVIDSIVNHLSPKELTKLLIDRNVDEIGKVNGIGKKWAELLLSRVNGLYENFLAIEHAKITDSINISYRLDSGEYKPLEKLSTGQKATVIVLLALYEGSQPVIFDQPEDALYTPFIYKDVVQLLKKERGMRQFIFATHNPNIAIASDLDLGIILEGTALDTSIKAFGGLDDEGTQKLLIVHLEGGKNAMIERYTKYGLNNNY